MKKGSITSYAEILHHLTRSAGVEELPKILRAYVAFLSRKKALGKIKKIIEKYEKIGRGEQGIVEALLITATKLTEHEKKEITGALKRETKASEVEIKEKIDETLIGGWKIKTDEYLIDASTKGKLNRLQIALTK